MDADGKRPHPLTSTPVDKETPSWCAGIVIPCYTSQRVAILVDVQTGDERMQESLATSGARASRAGRKADRASGRHAAKASRGARTAAGSRCAGLWGPRRPPDRDDTSVRDRCPTRGDGDRRSEKSSDPSSLFEVKLVDVSEPSEYGTRRGSRKKCRRAEGCARDGHLAVVNELAGRKEISLEWKDGRWLWFDSDVEGSRQIDRMNLVLSPPSRG